MTTLIIATRNPHKIHEIRAILGNAFEYRSLEDFPGAPAVIEDADTFAGNAAKKALEIAAWLAARQTGPKPQIPNPKPQTRFVLADDSGLEVDVLNGAPGVYSARFAALDSTVEGNRPDADNNAKLLRLLQDVPRERRTALFRCVIALAAVEPVGTVPTARFFDGTCEGHIECAPRGKGGFGYDPLFIPEGFTESFAELGEATKNKLSHRAKALAQLRVALQTPANA
jgi:XTP/dITP diphosphohydrolase